MPEARQAGLGVGSSGWPAAFALALATSLSFFWALFSGAYLAANLNNWVAVCLSKVFENWWTVGGTFSLCWMTAFCLWSLMYFGHLTNRDKSLFGWMSWPIPKFLDLFSKRGLVTLAFFWPLLRGAMDLDFPPLDLRTIF